MKRRLGQSLAATIAVELKRAEKDNDFIYLEAVPAQQALAPLDKVQLAQIMPFPTLQSLQPAMGTPLLGNLYPHVVHLQMAAYAERKTHVVRSWVERCQAASQDVGR